MLIQHINISNWRSFYGTNGIFVSTDPTKNVTLIRAENGVGKTSLLAAINWCFFNILPSESEFEDPTKLVNKFAIERDKVAKTIVEIEFVHDGKTYKATRSFDQRTLTTSPLRLSEIKEGGEIPSPKDRPDRFIDSVIPREMAPHFFFYGEATSRYTGATGAKKFGEAVKGILGSTIARMALDDLRKSLTDYNRQASDNTSEEAQQAERDIELIATKIHDSRKKLNRLDEEIEAANARIHQLNQELAETKLAKELQNRRSRIELTLKAREAEKAKALNRADLWMQNFITAVLAEELIAEAEAVVTAEDTRGKLPAPYDQKLVNEIIQDGKCICGRPVLKDSAEYDLIKSLLETAGDQAVMSRVMSTNVALGRLAQKAEQAWSDYDRNNADLRKVEAEIQALDADLVDISKQLAANPGTDIAEKEAARERAKSQYSQAANGKVTIQTQISDLERMQHEIERKRDDLVKKSAAAQRFVKRAQLAAALTARLDRRLRAEEEAARAEIEREIDEIVQKFMRKSATVKLDKDYQLRLFDENKLELAKSTGENQLLGLAFTGAIAKYAKEREKDVNDILLPGTVAPLVVDSPFGHLDPLYRRGVAEFLPNLASQVILLVSTSQASETVMTTLADKVGQEYVLTRYNRIDGEGKQSETIDVGGKSYDLTVYNSEFEGTRVTEVS
jgi:DNA sulfur modification protein DndD